MKKLILFILSFIITVQMSMVCFAQSANTIYAEKTILAKNEIQLIPVNISNNSGIMGFKITVEYPREYINIKSVTKGSVTSTGSFNHNLGLKNNKVDIIWNSIEDIKKDGSLFVLGIELLNQNSEDITIKLTFSQEDTFNEKWEDVIFCCKDIIISTDYNEVSTVNSDSSTNAESAKADSSQIIDALTTALMQNGYGNLKEVQDAEKIIKDFNKNLQIITGTDEHSADDFNTVKNMYNSAYEDNFINETSNSVDSAKIKSAINETLTEFNAKSMDMITGKDKAMFVQNFENKLKEQNPDIPNISEDLEVDIAFNIIKKLYNLTSTEKNGQQNNSSGNKYNVFIFVVFSAALAALSGSIIIVKKRKAKNKVL